MITSVEARPGTRPGTGPKLTRGSRQRLAPRTRARSADAKLSRTRTTNINEAELTEGASTPNHQVTPFTPRSLEEWKYVQKHGEQGQDGNMDAQEMRWLRFLITDVDGCDEDGNPWLTTHTKGGRKGSVTHGGLDAGKEEGDDDDAVSPLKWYDNQHTPTTTPLHSNHNKQSTSNGRRSRSRSPTAANEMIQYHQSISTATVIATTSWWFGC